MNQVTISNLMMQIKHNDLSVDLVRHLVLNSIRSYRTKFSNDYGELILCYDIHFREKKKGHDQRPPETPSAFTL